MSYWTQLFSQNPTSPAMTMLTYFHDSVMMIMLMIMMMIGYSLLSMFLNKLMNRKMKEAYKSELIWTIVPSMILMFLAMPSLRLLYLMEETEKPELTIKTMGLQWYWKYEYNDFNDINYDSFMTKNNMLKTGEYRLMEVDNRLIIPTKTKIRLLITASDVIHSWTVPSLGVKADAIPGRLNQLSFMSLRSGVFYGQCSEICGINHSFMPIVMESVKTQSFINWMKKL